MAEQTVRIGRRIAQARAEADLTQGELAAKIPGKAGSDQVSKWERGIHRPGDDTLEQIALALGRDVSWFLVEEVDKGSTPDPFPDTGRENDPPWVIRIEKLFGELARTHPDADHKSGLAILTTNYDDLLEKALAEVAEVKELQARSDERLAQIEGQLKQLLGAIGADGDSQADLSDRIVRVVEKAISQRATEAGRRPPRRAPGTDRPDADQRDAA